MRWRAVALIVGLVIILLLIVGIIRRQREEEAPEPIPTPEVTGEISPAPTASPPVRTATPVRPITGVSIITQQGGRVSWSPSGDLIAFDRKGDDSFYDVWTMKPDGSQQRCLTCDVPGLPGKNMGQPAWHPSGEYIVFQAEKAEHPGGFGSYFRSSPGVGVYNDLWLITADGSRAFQLTNVPEQGGVLHPQFSHGGTKLLWAQMLSPAGRKLIGDEWALELADFVSADGEPRIEKIRTFQPGGPVFYETHGFSPDDSKIIFSGNLDGQPLWAIDIYTMDLQTQQVVNLTGTPDQWDEHAHFSPSGNKIVWISSRDCDCDPSKPGDVRTDLWIMNADGSGKTRLTHFSDRSFPEGAGKVVLAGDNDWSPDGTKVAIYSIPERGVLELLGLRPLKEWISTVEFPGPQ